MAMGMDDTPLDPGAELRRLLQLMADLRHPATGCPWDQVQTFDTIAPYTIEEAYEVADAIARRDMAALPDELGDLLFQVVYHARMAEEAGAFAFADVGARHHGQDDPPATPTCSRLRSAWQVRLAGKRTSRPSAPRSSSTGCWLACRAPCPP